MSNFAWLLIVAAVVVVVLLLLIRPKIEQFLKPLLESFFKNIGVPYRNSIGLLLGAIGALLPLATKMWDSPTAAWVFVILVAITMLLLIVVRPNSRKRIYFFSWGLWVIIVLGFGLGALLWEARPWWIWLWKKYRFINEPHELLLEALFLLGVILGVFVVRNWGKEDKAFMESLAGFLGGTFIATVLGNVQPPLTPVGAVAYYLLGFALSATLNLLLAARLTANYTNKRSIASRALLDFLYGSDRTKIIDGYFLKNFEKDPNYAKSMLQDTLLKYRTLLIQQLAEAMKKRMELRASPPAGQPPVFFYELFAIECEKKADTEEKTDTDDSPLSSKDKDRKYDVLYKRLDATKLPIKEDMFRVSIAMRRQDVLEYIVAPGQYQATFPFGGSVAGLSLTVRQTIVMDRDIDKKFRSREYRDGICPRAIEQWRGLDEIEYLSYISIPVVAHLGHANENPLGIVNVDTKIFVTDEELAGDEVSANMFRTQLTPNQLNEYARKLYDQEDEIVKHLEKLTRVIEPVLELYAKCLVGAT